MLLSYIIVTHNRAETLVRTLSKLREHTPLARWRWDVWIVDNGSTDGTPDAAEQAMPGINVIRRPTNEGIWARTYAMRQAQGEYFILLDDDSYPIGDAVAQMLPYMDEHPQTAALVARVVLPDGSFEACAFPSVMLGGATCLRRSVVERVGGFSPEFFRQAEEYDLSFRIWRAGYAIERFEDVLFMHEKVSSGRSSALVHRMDVRNNRILLERFLPGSLRRAYRRDWTQRYRAIAQQAGHASDCRRGVWESRKWMWKEAVRGRQILDERSIEQVFQIESQAKTVADWSRGVGIRRAVIADFSKNLFATYHACRRAGIQIEAIADNGGAFVGQRYRGIDVLSDSEISNLKFDGIVLSNINPAQIDRRLEQLAHFNVPVLRLWHPKFLKSEGAEQCQQAAA